MNAPVTARDMRSLIDAARFRPAPDLAEALRNLDTAARERDEYIRATGYQDDDATALAHDDAVADARRLALSAGWLNGVDLANVGTAL